MSEWERVLLASNEDAELVAANRLLEWLKNKPQHRTLLSIQKNGQKPRPSASRLRSLLMTLKNHGWIRSADEKFTSFVVWGDK
jgi:DNA-binding IclR family transcriptional regulator